MNTSNIWDENLCQIVTVFSHFLTAAEQYSIKSNAKLTTEGELPAKKKRRITAANANSQDIDVIIALQSKQQNQGSQTFD